MTEIAAAPFPPSSSRTLAWRKQDTLWMLGLYGTAIGAGTLFLPINAGIGGVWPLIILTLLAFPMTFFSHRAFCRFVLSGSAVEGDITEAAEEHFGKMAGNVITILYFFAIYPFLLMYSVAITNTVESFIVHQLGMMAPPRVILSLVLVLSLMAVVRCGGQMIVKAMSVLVFPFVFALLWLSIYLIPSWNMSVIEHTGSLDSVLSGDFVRTLWLAIPVMVFSFNHSPIISSFAVANRQYYGEKTDAKCCRIMLASHIMMMVTVMFFVFSCVFSLSPLDLASAKEQNISILSYLANKFDNPFIAAAAPFIAFLAISKSFLGHYLGAQEGLNGLIVKALRERGKSIELSKLNRFTAIFVIITSWFVATINPSILGMIEVLGGPIIALLLFLMPMYAMRRVPAMRQFAGKPSNVFVTVTGLIAISAIFYVLLFGG